MTTSRVSIDLSLGENFQALPYLKNQLDATVDTKPRPIVPKVLWALNVLATENGVRSASFAAESVAPIPVLSNPSSALYRQVEVIDTKGNLSYMLMDDTPGPTGDRIYYLLTADKQWTRFVSDFYTTEIYFPVKYTLYQNRSIVLWTLQDVLDPAWTAVNPTLNTAFLDFDLVTKTATFYELSGGEQFAGQTRGIASWGNYMIAYTDTRIFWSNPLNLADFVPVSGGAGSASITEAQGPILLVVPNTRGLLIYCRNNIVFAEYSGDSTSPWIFGEVQGSEGIMIYEGEPLVSRNEQSPFQVALTGQGLMIVTNQGAEPAPAAVNNLLGLEYTEYRDEGKILRHYYGASGLTQYKYNKVKRVDLFGTKMFILIGELDSISGNEDFNRLLIYDVQTGDVAWIQGDIRSIVPTLNLDQTMTTGRDQHRKISPVVNSFVLTKRIISAGQPLNKNIILDFANTTTAEELVNGGFQFNTPELMIGTLRVRRGYSTNLYTVRLCGVYSTAYEGEPVDLDTVAQVFVYSEYDDFQTPTEFIFEPKDNTFRGFATGEELRIIVKGEYLKLTEVEFEIALGGSSGF